MTYIECATETLQIYSYPVCLYCLFAITSVSEMNFIANVSELVIFPFVAIGHMVGEIDPRK